MIVRYAIGWSTATANDNDADDNDGNRDGFFFFLHLIKLFVNISFHLTPRIFILNEIRFREVAHDSENGLQSYSSLLTSSNRVNQSDCMARSERSVNCELSDLMFWLWKQIEMGMAQKRTKTIR